MSNSYFKFKQFVIKQGNCGMKVSTDACIQGAWTPVPTGAKQVLDIGTGTGLLSLMLVQRYKDIQIDAIELDEYAAAEAKDNVLNAPWSDRINVCHADVNTYEYTYQYDYVICNPPFFNNSLLGPTQTRNQARHTVTLTFESLIRLLKQVLKPDGEASILLPIEAVDYWQSLLHGSGGYVSNILEIRPKATSKVNRMVLVCRFDDSQKDSKKEQLVIYNEDRTYTEAFAKLLSPFYLKL